MNVKLHIERVVLEGVPLGEGDSRRVQVALETELGRLIADGGGVAVWPSGPYVRGGDIGLTAGEDPGMVGRHIAGALYGGIVR